MVLVSHSCTCELAQSRSVNRSGIGKTSTGSVRNLLSHGHTSTLASPSRHQAARSGPVTSAVNGLYRTGLV